MSGKRRAQSVRRSKPSLFPGLWRKQCLCVYRNQRLIILATPNFKIYFIHINLYVSNHHQYGRLLYLEHPLTLVPSLRMWSRFRLFSLTKPNARCELQLLLFCQYIFVKWSQWCHNLSFPTFPSRCRCSIRSIWLLRQNLEPPPQFTTHFSTWVRLVLDTTPSLESQCHCLRYLQKFPFVNNNSI